MQLVSFRGCVRTAAAHRDSLLRTDLAATIERQWILENSQIKAILSADGAISLLQKSSNIGWMLK